MRTACRCTEVPFDCSKLQLAGRHTVAAIISSGMRQRQEFIDQRLKRSCIYCGKGRLTREHAPSKTFLDRPYPENLPVVSACKDCNNGFSLDEEYLSALIECTLRGSADAANASRPKVREILERSPALAARLAAARQKTEGGTLFTFEAERVRNVVVKLARGHAAFELAEFDLGEPDVAEFVPLHTLTQTQREDFENAPQSNVWPEVGCRAMISIVEDYSPYGPWQIFQEGRYRYLASVYCSGNLVRMVLSEYLACEVIWQ